MSRRALSDPTLSPWLHLAGRLGRIGANFMIVSFFAALFSPIVFLLEPQSLLDPTLPGVQILGLFADPARLLAIADFLGLIGHVVLAVAFGLVLVGLVRGDRQVPILAALAGGVVVLLLLGWVLLMYSSQGAARGAITNVDAAAATGGWSVASALLLVASLAYMVLTARVDLGIHHRRMTSLWWPAFAAVNLLGSVAVAGFFIGLAGGTAIAESLSLGLVLKVTLVPMLGVLAYGDLKDRIQRWADLRLMMGATIIRTVQQPQAEPFTFGNRPSFLDTVTRAHGSDSVVTVVREEPTKARTRVRPPV